MFTNPPVEHLVLCLFPSLLYQLTEPEIIPQIYLYSHHANARIATNLTSVVAMSQAAGRTATIISLLLVSLCRYRLYEYRIQSSRSTTTHWAIDRTPCVEYAVEMRIFCIFWQLPGRIIGGELFVCCPSCFFAVARGSVYGQHLHADIFIPIHHSNSQLIHGLIAT